MTIAARCTFVVDATPIANIRVVEVPVTCIVALGTIRTEQPGMTGRCVVTGGTSVGEADIPARSMATVAGQSRMSICQREPRMVEISRQPAAGVVAQTAIGTELTIMSIVLLMTCVAGSWSTPIKVVDMAISTGDLNVFTGQTEGSQIVVKGCRQPAAGRVAFPAVRAEPLGVGIDTSMAINTQRWCPLKGIIDVTIYAGNIDMFSGQHKLENVVVEGCRQPTSCIMA